MTHLIRSICALVLLATSSAGLAETSPTPTETEAKVPHAEAPSRPRIDQLPLGDPARLERQAPVVLDAITDTHSGDILDPVELAERLADVRLLLVGETHTSDEDHRVQEAVIRALLDAGRRVVVGLEMMPRERQHSLDAWVDGSLDEEAMLEVWYQSWGAPWSYYRAIFELARERGLPLRALNVPRSVVRATRMRPLDELPAAERALLPPRIEPSSDAHRRLFLAHFEQGDDEDPLHTLDDEMVDGMVRAQVTWDAAMAWSAVETLRSEPWASDPSAIAVVLAGSGHVVYGLGIERQAAPWLDAPIRTLVPVPVEKAGERIESVVGSYADFVWGVANEPWPRVPPLGVFTRTIDGRVTILFVDPTSPAVDADLAPGDVLLRADGLPLDSSATLQRLMAGKHWGESIVLERRRAAGEGDGTEVDGAGEDDTRSVTIRFRRSP